MMPHNKSDHCNTGYYILEFSTNQMDQLIQEYSV